MNDFVNIVGKITQYKDEPAVNENKRKFTLFVQTYIVDLKYKKGKRELN